MSGNEDVVKLEDDLVAAIEKGGDAALNEALRGMAVHDDGLPDPDDDDAGDGVDGQGGGEHEADGGAAGGDDGGAKGKEAPAADAAAAGATDGGKPAGAASAGQESRPGQGEDQPLPVANKAGTGTIPYEVLTGARKQAAQANAELASTKAKLEETQAELAKLTQAQAGGGKPAGQGQQAGAAEAVVLTDEDLADMPEPVQKLARYARSLEGKVAQLETATSRVFDDHAQHQQESTQDAIDAVPDIAEWQAKGGTLWRAAVDKDQALRSDPAWANKPMRERFEHVAKAVREEIGLPPRQQNQQQNQGKPGGAAAAAKAAELAPPASQSHIPGGGAPALDANDSIERTSVTGLAARMNGMRDSDIDALLSQIS